MDVLIHATMKVLKIDEDEALTVLRQRLVKPKRKDDEGTKALLELDEAMKCVEPADQDVLQTEQKKTVEDAATHEEFVLEWKQKRQAAKAKKSGKATSSSSAKRSKTDKSKQQPPQKLPPNLDSIEQKEAKLFMPEGSCLWKNRSAGAWISKVNGFAECSRTVSKYGNAKALGIVIANAWHDWCVDNGVPFAECPMKGLPELEED